MHEPLLIESQYADWDHRSLWMVAVIGGDGGLVIPMMLNPEEVQILNRLKLAILMIKKNKPDFWPTVDLRLPTEQDLEDNEDPDFYPDQFSVWEEW